jgi:hypothetical protein
MKKVIEYTIITKDSTNGLQRQVNKHITEGWEVYGELAIVNYNHFCQTMVKYEKPKLGGSTGPG